MIDPGIGQGRPHHDPKRDREILFDMGKSAGMLVLYVVGICAICILTFVAATTPYFR